MWLSLLNIFGKNTTQVTFLSSQDVLSACPIVGDLSLVVQLRQAPPDFSLQKCLLSLGSSVDDPLRLPGSLFPRTLAPHGF